MSQKETHNNRESPLDVHDVFGDFFTMIFIYGVTLSIIRYMHLTLWSPYPKAGSFLYAGLFGIIVSISTCIASRLFLHERRVASMFPFVLVFWLIFECFYWAGLCFISQLVPESAVIDAILMGCAFAYTTLLAVRLLIFDPVKSFE